MKLNKRVGVALVAATACAGYGTAAILGAGPALASASVVIKAVLPPNTGPATAADNAGLLSFTKQYENAHSGVTVEWLPNNTSSITAANAAVEAQASGPPPRPGVGTVRPGYFRVRPSRAPPEHQAVCRRPTLMYPGTRAGCRSSRHR